MEQHKQEQRQRNQRVIKTATTRARARAPADLNEKAAESKAVLDDIDSTTYNSKVRINHWHDKMMEHKKIYYAAELKMFKLELALAKYDNSSKLRWSVRHREMANMIHHDDEDKPKRHTPEPAFGYVPMTRRLKSEPEINEGRQKESIEGDDDSNDTYSISGDSIKNDGNDVIPIHSEDYKPFSSTPSIHSYMYHLRKIYGK